MINIYKKLKASTCLLLIASIISPSAFASIPEVSDFYGDTSVERGEDIDLQWRFEGDPEFTRCVGLGSDDLHTRTNIGTVQWNETTYEPIDSASFPTTSSYISSSTTSLEIGIKCFRTDQTSEIEKVTITIEDNNNSDTDIEITSVYLLDTASNVQKGDTITTKGYINITGMDNDEDFTYHVYMYDENNGYLEYCYKNLTTDEDTRDGGTEDITVNCEFDYFEDYDPNGKEYNFRAYVDKYDNIDEDNENNNYETRTYTIGDELNADVDLGINNIYLIDSASGIEKGDTITTRSTVDITGLDNGEDYNYYVYLYDDNDNYLEYCRINTQTSEDTRDGSVEDVTLECELNYFENHEPNGEEYTLKAYLDKNDFIDEDNETNNDAQRTYTIGDELNADVDLELTSIYLQDTASNVQKGDTINTKGYINITGMDNLENYNYYVYLYDDNNNNLEYCYINTQTNEDTRDGSSESVILECEFNYFENHEPNGEVYTFKAYVDKNDYIDESNESNNYKTRTYTIGDELNADVDLELTSIYLQDTASNVEKGDTVNTKGYVNVTGMDDNKTFSYYVYLYDDNNNSLDYCYKNIETDYDTRNGNTENITVECEIDYFENHEPNGKEYNFRAYVDKNNSIDEDSETNNYAQRTYIIGGEQDDDLDIELTSVYLLGTASNVEKGDTVNTKGYVNVTGMDDNKTFSYYVYLYDDNNNSLDYCYKNIETDYDTRNGNTENITVECEIDYFENHEPNGKEYNFRAYVDKNNSIYEDSETNNYAQRTYIIGGEQDDDLDIELTSVYLLETASNVEKGDTVNTKGYVNVTGMDDNKTFSYYVYLYDDNNNSLDYCYKNIETDYDTRNGNTENITVECEIDYFENHEPNGKEYNFRAYVDKNNSIDEDSETNNYAQRTYIIGGEQDDDLDIELTSVYLLGTASNVEKGDTVNTKGYVNVTGMDDNKTFSYYVYLYDDNNNSLDYCYKNIETDYDTRNGNTENITVECEIDYFENHEPNGKEYNFRAYVDKNNSIDEDSETNNYAQRTYIIGGEQDDDLDIELTSVYLLETASNVEKGDTVNTKGYVNVTGMDDNKTFSYYVYLYDDNNNSLDYCYKNIETDYDTRNGNTENITVECEIDYFENHEPNGKEYNFRAYVDKNNSIDEDSETNNYAQRTYIIGGEQNGECSNNYAPVCGIRYSGGNRIYKTFVNRCYLDKDPIYTYSSNEVCIYDKLPTSSIITKINNLLSNLYGKLENKYNSDTQKAEHLIRVMTSLDRIGEIKPHLKYVVDYINKKLLLQVIAYNYQYDIQSLVDILN